MPNFGLAFRSYAVRILCASSTRHLQCPDMHICASQPTEDSALHVKHAYEGLLAKTGQNKTLLVQVQTATTRAQSLALKVFGAIFRHPIHR